MKKAKEANTDPRAPRLKSDYCPHDGSRLVERGGAFGFCGKADGWPLMNWFARETGRWEAQGVRCPFACPGCGNRLEWDGSCHHCAAGAQGAAPGDRYTLIRNHWIYERGPEAALTETRRAELIVRYRTLIADILADPTIAALGG